MEMFIRPQETGQGAHLRNTTMDPGCGLAKDHTMLDTETIPRQEDMDTKIGVESKKKAWASYRKEEGQAKASRAHTMVPALNVEYMGTARTTVQRREIIPGTMLRVRAHGTYHEVLSKRKGGNDRKERKGEGKENENDTMEVTETQVH